MSSTYADLIDQIVTATLKGKIRSKAQVYRMLQEGIAAGEGELFERSLQTRMDQVATQLESGDEMQQAKAQRQQRALKTIAGEWQHRQQDNQASSLLEETVGAIATAEPPQRLQVFLNAIDINQSQSLQQEQLKDLSQQLQHQAETQPELQSLGEMATGIKQGLTRWQELEANIVSWIYDQRQQLGFGGSVEPQGPWYTWSQSVSSGSLKRVLADLAQHQAITAEGIPTPLSVSAWLEMVLVMQRLQLRLITWFDQQPYDPKAGKRLSISTFLTFAVVWSQLSERLQQIGQGDLAKNSFLMVLQVLRQFSQQAYFPLYGGLFAALSGEPLKTLLDYLDRPLQEVPNTQSKARILTLLGYSQRALGNYRRATEFHQRALEIARSAQDRPCEIANLNHLSRCAVQQQDYTVAIDHSQRALISARQGGDRLGEANALANLGYSQVFQAQDALPDPDQYESILVYLEQGLALSEKLNDRPSQALCAHSLGVARQVLGQDAEAIDALETGLVIAQSIGDAFLQGMNYAYMAPAYQRLDDPTMAIYTGALAMYLLKQIDSAQWRQPARILSILYGQLGPEQFQATLASYRAGFLKQIGVDGYDYLPQLLAQYRETLEG